MVLVNYSPYQDDAYIANFTAIQMWYAVKHNTLILYQKKYHMFRCITTMKMQILRWWDLTNNAYLLKNKYVMFVA
jgi:hypothetical protein